MYISTGALALIATTGLGSSVIGAKADHLLDSENAHQEEHSSSFSGRILRGLFRKRLRGSSNKRKSDPNDKAVAHQSTTTPRKLSACYESYTAGASYNLGDIVSATITGTSNPNYTRDPNTGLWIMETPTTTTMSNYKCISTSWCGLKGYGPGEAGESSAWEREDVECSVRGAATLTAPTPPPLPLWSGTGCPSAYKAGTNYDGGDVVSVNGQVYQCAEEPSNLWCGMTGYEPNNSQHWTSSWSMVGSCSGTLSPTDSPSFEVFEVVGGCSAEYEYGGVNRYDGGDRVSHDSFIYQCKSWPRSLLCSQAGYEPGYDQVTEDWKYAWSLIGHCRGQIAPTSSPTFVSLQNLGRCPTPHVMVGPHVMGFGGSAYPPGVSSWQWGNHAIYEPGDTVSVNFLVFRCKPWPYGNHCAEQGYEPGTNPATPGAWMAAWELIGYCEGTKSPSLAPSESSSPTTSSSPTKTPTVAPTEVPTSSPTKAPSMTPTKSPTTMPTDVPTSSPTNAPSTTPIKNPTLAPTPPPTPPPSPPPSRPPSPPPTRPPSPPPTRPPSPPPTRPLSPPPTPFPSIELCVEALPDSSYSFSNPGHCISINEDDRFDFLFTDSVKTEDDCLNYCVNIPNGHLLGFEVMIEPQNEGCSCLYENGKGPDITPEFETLRDYTSYAGTGYVYYTDGTDGVTCFEPTYQGHCRSSYEDRFDFLFTDSVQTKDDCLDYCINIPEAEHLVGFEVAIEPQNEGCSCLYVDGMGPNITQDFETERDYTFGGKGDFSYQDGTNGVTCFQFCLTPDPNANTTTTTTTAATGPWATTTRRSAPP